MVGKNTLVNDSPDFIQHPAHTEVSVDESVLDSYRVHRRTFSDTLYAASSPQACPLHLFPARQYQRSQTRVPVLVGRVACRLLDSPEWSIEKWSHC
jgi:hypothetical protein